MTPRALSVKHVSFASISIPVRVSHQRPSLTAQMITSRGKYQPALTDDAIRISILRLIPPADEPYGTRMYKAAVGSDSAASAAATDTNSPKVTDTVAHIPNDVYRLLSILQRWVHPTTDGKMRYTCYEEYKAEDHSAKHELLSLSYSYPGLRKFLQSAYESLDVHFEVDGRDMTPLNTFRKKVGSVSIIFKEKRKRRDPPPPPPPVVKSVKWDLDSITVDVYKRGACILDGKTRCDHDKTSKIACATQKCNMWACDEKWCYGSACRCSYKKCDGCVKESIIECGRCAVSECAECHPFTWCMECFKNVCFRCITAMKPAKCRSCVPKCVSCKAEASTGIQCEKCKEPYCADCSELHFTMVGGFGDHPDSTALLCPQCL